MKEYNKDNKKRKTRNKKIIISIVILLSIFLFTRSEINEEAKIQYEKVVEFAELTDSKESLLSVAEKNRPGVIASIPPEWIFNTTDQDELNHTIEQISQNYTHTCFRIEPDVYDSKVTNKIGYKFKIELNYTDEISHKKETIVKDKTALDIKKGYEFCVSNLLERFTIKLGENSTTIEGQQALFSSTWYSNSKSICRDLGDVWRLSFAANSDDVWVGNTTDEGDSFNTSEIDSTASHMVSSMCDHKNSSYVYGKQSNELFFYNRTPLMGLSSKYILGTVWGSAIDSLDCRMDGRNIGHCCAVDSSGRLFYVNTTAKSIRLIIDDSGNDLDHCDINADENNHIYLFATGADDDDLYAWRSDTGFGASDIITLCTGSSVTTVAGNGLDSVIDRFGNVVIGWIDNYDLQLANTSTDNFATANTDCQELDSAASSTPEIVFTENNNGEKNDLWIFYGSEDGYISTNDRIKSFFFNSSDSTWSSQGEPLNEDSGHPSILGGDLFETYNITDKLHYIYTASIGGSAEVRYSNISIPYTTPDAPTSQVNITWITPEDNTNRSNVPNVGITFTYNVSSANPVDNCSLIINGSINYTDFSITLGVNQSINVTLTNATGGTDYNWSITCWDDQGFQGEGTQDEYTLTVNETEYISSCDYTSGEWVITERCNIRKETRNIGGYIHLDESALLIINDSNISAYGYYINGTSEVDYILIDDFDDNWFNTTEIGG